jgi:hypothetical protein
LVIEGEAIAEIDDVQHHLSISETTLNPRQRAAPLHQRFQ